MGAVYVAGTAIVVLIIMIINTIYLSQYIGSKIKDLNDSIIAESSRNMRYILAEQKKHNHFLMEISNDNFRGTTK